MTTADSEVHTYSANAPPHEPNTSLPGLNCVTFLPSASTSPATINAWSPCGLWFAQPSLYAKDVRGASDEVPVKGIDGSGANLYQDLLVPNGRLVNVLVLKNVW